MNDLLLRNNLSVAISWAFVTLLGFATPTEVEAAADETTYDHVVFLEVTDRVFRVRFGHGIQVDSINAALLKSDRIGPIEFAPIADLPEEITRRQIDAVEIGEWLGHGIVLAITCHEPGSTSFHYFWAVHRSGEWVPVKFLYQIRMAPTAFMQVPHENRLPAMKSQFCG